MMVYVDKQLHTLKRQDCVKFPRTSFHSLKRIVITPSENKTPGRKINSMDQSTADKVFKRQDRLN